MNRTQWHDMLAKRVNENRREREWEIQSQALDRAAVRIAHGVYDDEPVVISQEEFEMMYERAKLNTN